MEKETEKQLSDFMTKEGYIKKSDVVEQRARLINFARIVNNQTQIIKSRNGFVIMMNV